MGKLLYRKGNLYTSNCFIRLREFGSRHPTEVEERAWLHTVFKDLLDLDEHRLALFDQGRLSDDWLVDRLATTTIEGVIKHGYVATAFTRREYGHRKDRVSVLPEDIEKALRETCDWMIRADYATVHPKGKSRRLNLPKMGCLGGLAWNSVVKPIYRKVAADYPSIPFVVWHQ